MQQREIERQLQEKVLAERDLDREHREKQKKEAAESVHGERAVYKERLAETISERN